MRIDAMHLQVFRKARRKKNELRDDVLLDQKKTRISTSNIRTEASETVVLFDKATAAPNRQGLV